MVIFPEHNIHSTIALHFCLFVCLFVVLRISFYCYILHVRDFLFRNVAVTLHFNVTWILFKQMNRYPCCMADDGADRVDEGRNGNEEDDNGWPRCPCPPHLRASPSRPWRGPRNSPRFYGVRTFSIITLRCCD